MTQRPMNEKMYEDFKSLLRGSAVFLVFSLCFYAVINCAAVMAPQKSFPEMSPKEKAIYVMSMYNKQYDQYLALYEKGNHSEEEKRILQTKYDMLKELHPYVGIYLSYSETGVLPAATIEEKLIALINRMVQN